MLASSACASRQPVPSTRPCDIPAAYVARWETRGERSLEELLRRACPRVEANRQAGADVPILIDNGTSRQPGNYAQLLTMHPSTVWKVRVTDTVFVELIRR